MEYICTTDKPPNHNEPFSALQERQVADIRTEPVQRRRTELEQLVASPLQQEPAQSARTLPALSPARQQAVQNSWQRAALPLYQALRPQLEALQQIQDPTQRRMMETALERPFYLLWQEAARRQTDPAICIPSLSHILRQPSPPEGLLLLSFHTCRPLHAIHSAKSIPVGRNPFLLFATVIPRGAHSPR